MAFGKHPKARVDRIHVTAEILKKDFDIRPDKVSFTNSLVTKMVADLLVQAQRYVNVIHAENETGDKHRFIVELYISQPPKIAGLHGENVFNKPEQSKIEIVRG